MSKSVNAPNQQDKPQSAVAAEQAASAPIAADGLEAVKQKVVEVLKLVYDPEIPVSIYELGLVYDIAVQPSGHVDIKMTLTSPACPVAQDLPLMAKSRVETVAEVTEADVEIVWDPPWTPEMMSDEAKVALDMFY